MDTQVAPTEPEMAPSLIGGRLGWRAPALLADQRWIHHLNDTEIGELEAAVAQSRLTAPDILDIRRSDFPLPKLASRIATLREDILERYGFGYLRGLPVNRYDRDTLTRMYFGLGNHLGDPVPQNRNGHMLAHVIDIGTSVHDVNKRITQTNAELDFHSDGCDVVGLLCINTARSGGESALVSGIALHDEMLRLRPDLCAALYQPLTSDRRGEVPEGKQPWMRIPVFMWQHGSFTGYAPLKAYLESARRFTGAEPTTPLQWEAMQMFLDLANSPEFALRIPFEPGDFQFVENHMVFHSRTTYDDWPEVTRRRHLMRLWLSMPDGRELHPAIAERWIHIKRGTLRGGVNIPDRKALSIPLDPLTPAYT